MLPDKPVSFALGAVAFAFLAEGICGCSGSNGAGNRAASPPGDAGQGQMDGTVDGSGGTPTDGNA